MFRISPPRALRSVAAIGMTFAMANVAAADTGMPPEMPAALDTGLDTVEPMAQGPYSGGPFLGGLTSPWIQAIVDHAAAWTDPYLPVDQGYYDFAELQLTAPFECWKWDGLCEQYGPQLAEDFVLEYIQLVQEFPSLEAYIDISDEMINRYEEMAEDLDEDDFELSPAEALAYANAVDELLPELEYEQIPLSGYSASVTTESSSQAVESPLDVVATASLLSTGDFRCSVGRTRYIVGGHSWAKCRTTNRSKEVFGLSRLFEVYIWKGNPGAYDLLGEPVPKEKMLANAKRRVISTGQFRDVIFNTIDATTRALIMAVDVRKVQRPKFSLGATAMDSNGNFDVDSSVEREFKKTL